MPGVRGSKMCNFLALSIKIEINDFFFNYEKKYLSEVGFEPTPTFVDQNALFRYVSYQKVINLESGALDHSVILTIAYTTFKH